MGAERSSIKLATDMGRFVDDTAEAYGERLGDDNLETGGGGGHTGDMNDWQTTVETRLAGLQADFRWTWSGMAVGFLALGGMLITGYLMLDSRFVSVDGRLDKIEQNTAVMRSEISDLRGDISDVRRDVSAILGKLTK